MSVLFNALNKAAAPAPAEAPAVMLAAAPVRRSRRGVRTLFGMLVILAVQGGAALYFLEDLLRLADTAKADLGLSGPASLQAQAPPDPPAVLSAARQVADTYTTQIAAAVEPKPEPATAAVPVTTAAALAAGKLEPPVHQPKPAPAPAPAVVPATARPASDDPIDRLAALLQARPDAAPANQPAPEPAESPAPPSPSLPAAAPPSAATEFIEAAPQVLGAEAPRSSGVQVSISTPAPENRQRQDAAYAALARGDMATAARLYGEWAKAEPASVPALMGEAAARHRMGDATAARAAYGRLLALDPGNRQVLTNLVALLAQEQPLSALAELDRLHRQHPDFAPIPAQIGMVKATLGDLAGAAEALRAAVRLAPTDARIQVNHAVLLDKAGRRGEAAQAYRRALDLIGPTTDSPLPRDAILQRLRYLEGG